MLAIGIVAVPIYARVMRSSVLTVREQDYVTAARALGDSPVEHPAPPSHSKRASRRSSSRPPWASARPCWRSPRSRSSAWPRRRRTPEWGSMIGLERNQLFTSPLPRLHSRRRADPDRARLQPAGRRPARRLRSAAQPMTQERAEPTTDDLGDRALARRNGHRGARPRGGGQAARRPRRGPARRPRPAHLVQAARRHRPCRDRHRLLRPPRRDPGPRRRIRLRQERHLAVDHAPHRAARRDRGRRGHVRRPGPAEARRERDARASAATGSR